MNRNSELEKADWIFRATHASRGVRNPEALAPVVSSACGEATVDVTRRGMETLREALGRLERRGFREALRALPNGLLGRPGRGVVAPEDFAVDEIVRFEGESDPGDEAVLFALCSVDGQIRGTFVASYGPHTDPDCAAVIRRLRLECRKEVD